MNQSHSFEPFRSLAPLALLGVASLVLVASSAAGAAAAKQRVQMEARLKVAESGTFVLRPVSRGPLASDSGTFSFDASQKRLVRGGQSVIVFTVTSTWQGRRGSLVIRERVDDVAAGSGYRVGTGVWSLVSARGTGQYAELSGSGRSAYVVTPGERVLSRWEGIVDKP